MTNRISLQETSSGGIELQHPQQRTASHSDSIQDMENIPERSTTHSTCENRPQESNLLYNNQRVDVKTG